MRMITIEDELLVKARQFAKPGATDEELVRWALEVLIRTQAAKRLAMAGGSRPDMERIPRRRP
ncbi:VapB protein of antitoxin of type II toxin-antitoxin system [Pseudomonas sp. LP_7_YM]|nr:VapB protein of antitoxin of type II toxin-antitoxin system [Pseudomonas sp. LP_7_YM]